MPRAFYHNGRDGAGKARQLCFSVFCDWNPVGAVVLFSPARSGI